MPLFPSFGHFMVVLAYVATMSVLLFVNVTRWSDLFNWARRLGWLCRVYQFLTASERN